MAMKSFGRVGWMALGLVLMMVLLSGLSPATQSQAPEAERQTHLPLLQGVRPPPAPNRFGSELINNSANALALAEVGGVTWARQNHLSWAAVEPTPGARNWAALAGLEASLIARSEAGMTNLLIIGDTPTWARRDPTHICSAITPDALDDFAQFMVDLATRYNRPPYHVSHFELYNEPDVPASAVPSDSPFGCWGDERDPYYGGIYYSQMLSTIYPRVKEHNGNVQIVVGGLLLACDYKYRYPDRRRCDSAKFLRGILQHGNGENFDMVAYHGYPLHSSNRLDWERTFYPWAHRGGAVFGKLGFIREELAAYGVDVPILLTESALICYEGASCNNDQTLLRQDQAVYVVRLYSRAIANDLDGVLWYSFNDPGWRYAGLLDAQENPLPAYFAFKFMSTYLSRATYVATLGSGVNAPEGYAFRAEGRDVYVYWSNDARTYTMPFPPQAMLYDKVGTLLPPPTDGILTIGFEPVYLFFPLP